MGAQGLNKGYIACLVFVLIVFKIKISTNDNFPGIDCSIDLPTSKPSMMVFPNGLRPASRPVPAPKRFQSVDANAVASSSLVKAVCWIKLARVLHLNERPVTHSGSAT